jgi:hypothetical protein
VNRAPFWLAFLAVLALTRPAAAQGLLLETATFNATSDNALQLGYPDRDYSFPVVLTCTFHVSTPTVVANVGIANLTGSGGFFAAIVPWDADPQPTTDRSFQDGQLYGHAFFSPAGGDQRIPLGALLGPGDYQLIVGTAMFGTVGYGSIGTAGQTATPGTTCAYILFTPDSVMRVPVFAPVRVVVDGQPEAQSLLDAIAGKASQASVDAIDTRLASLATTIGSLRLGGVATTADVQSAALTLSGAIGTRASQSSVDELKKDVDEDGGLSRQLAIERALAGGTRLAGIFLPQALGGHLEDARDIVDGLLLAADQTGVRSHALMQAHSQFNTAERWRTTGPTRAMEDDLFAQWKLAFDAYANAYQLLVR